MKNKILVIAPHADDEILGCGGILKKANTCGIETIVVVVTNGHKGAPDMYSQNDVEATREEALNAHKVLGISETIFLDFPAPDLVNAQHFRISVSLSKIIQKIKPTQVYLPHPADLHSDHDVVYKSSLVALRPYAAPFVRDIYCYETLSESEWYPFQGIPGFRPNVFVDITKEIDAKCDAFSSFRSQIKEFPHSRSIEALRALAAYRGSTVNVESAESFELVRSSLRDGDLFVTN